MVRYTSVKEVLMMVRFRVVGASAGLLSWSVDEFIAGSWLTVARFMDVKEAVRYANEVGSRGVSAGGCCSQIESEQAAYPANDR
jgi:hypothetical protein